MSTQFQNDIVCSHRCPMGCVYSEHARALISSRDSQVSVSESLSLIFKISSQYRLELKILELKNDVKRFLTL